MDPLTHACLGYCVSRASTAAAMPRQAAVAGLVATFPDLDLVVQATLDPVAAFAFHRGPLHSMPCALLGGLLLAPVVARLTSVSVLRGAVLASIALVSHGLLDWLTGYGTALLWPLSERRFSLDLLFVVDPLLTLPLVAACGLDLLGPRHWRDSSARLAVLALVLVASYVGLVALLRASVRADFARELEADGLAVRAIHAEPTPGGGLLWYLCADTGDRYHMLYRSPWDGGAWERARHLPIDREPLRALGEDPLAQAMRNLFQGWYTCLDDEEGEGFAVIDVRLGYRHGWEGPHAPPAFRYRIEPRPGGAVALREMTHASNFDLGRLGHLLGRSLGHVPDGLRAPPPEGQHRAP